MIACIWPWAVSTQSSIRLKLYNTFTLSSVEIGGETTYNTIVEATAEIFDYVKSFWIVFDVKCTSINSAATCSCGSVKLSYEKCLGLCGMLMWAHC
jgi:hypothetical protein